MVAYDNQNQYYEVHRNLAVQYWFLKNYLFYEKKLSAPNKLVTIETMIYFNVKEVKVINSNKCKITFNISVSP